MREFLSKNKTASIVIIATIVLAAVALGTAFRLYQLRSQSVSPAAPESRPEAAATVIPSSTPGLDDGKTAVQCGVCGGIGQVQCGSGLKCVLTEPPAGVCVPEEFNGDALKFCQSNGACYVSFDISPASSPSPSPSVVPSPSPSSTPTSCNQNCTVDSDCAGTLICSGGVCRNPSCTGEADCTCPVATQPPVAGSCSDSCTSDADCSGNLTCSGGVCRNPSCTGEADCTCPVATPAPSLPPAGVSTPTVIGLAAGGLVLLLSVLMSIAL